VHGIPCSKRILHEGDIIELDLGIKWQGLHTDMAVTVGVGRIDAKAEKLLKATKEALNRGIMAARQGNYIGDIGFAIQSYAEAQGFTVVRELVGHGVGYFIHENPEVPNWGRPGTGLKLEQGLVIALEPMVCEGSNEIVLDRNSWTWKTRDHSRSAHFEHTIVILETGAEILTTINSIQLK